MVAVAGPPLGLAIDLYGRRYTLIFLTATGVVGCFVTARANSMGQVIGGQVCGLNMHDTAKCLNAVFISAQCITGLALVGKGIW